jgi:hypothetical protein
MTEVIESICQPSPEFQLQYYQKEKEGGRERERKRNWRSSF